MGWLFRKSFKIFPGIRLNFGKKGLTSATIGKSPFSTNVSKRGVRHTASIPGTGLRYQTQTTPFNSPQTPPMNQSLQTTWHCDQCGSLNVETNNFCGNCGQVKTALIHQQQQPPIYNYQQASLPPDNAKMVRNSWILFLGIAGCLIIGYNVVTSGFRQFSGSLPSSVQATPTPSPSPTPSPVATPVSLKGKSKKSKATTNVANTTSSTEVYGLYTKPVSPSPGRSTRSTTRSSSSGGYIRGPRGGCYYINGNGNKTYVDRSLCG